MVPRRLLESVLKHPQSCDGLRQSGRSARWATPNTRARDAGDTTTPTPAGTLWLYQGSTGRSTIDSLLPCTRCEVASKECAARSLDSGWRTCCLPSGPSGSRRRDWAAGADVRYAALIGLVVAAHPLFLVNGVRVANDALGTFFATVAIAGALTQTAGTSLCRALWVGPVIGFAVLAKSVHLALAPFAVAIWLAMVVLNRVPTRVRRRRPRGAGAGNSAPTLSQFAEDLCVMVARRSCSRRPSIAAGRTAADLLGTAVGMNWPRLIVSWWARKGLIVGGWSFLLPPRWLVDCYTLLVGLGLCGWVWLVLRRGRGIFRSATTSAACAALAASYTAGLAYHAIHSTAAGGFATTNAWYAAAAMPWFLALVAGGALCWPLGPLRFAGPALLGLAFVVAEGTVVWGAMTTTYAGGLGGSAGLVRLAAAPDPGPGDRDLVCGHARDACALC